MYWNCDIPCTTYYGNRCRSRSRRLHLWDRVPRNPSPEEALFQCSLLGQRGFIGVEDVEHPWVERLHDAQRVGRDTKIFVRRSDRLVPANISLKERMTMIRMHKKRAHYSILLSLMVTLFFKKKNNSQPPRPGRRRAACSGSAGRACRAQFCWCGPRWSPRRPGAR